MIFRLDEDSNLSANLVDLLFEHGIVPPMVTVESVTGT